MSKKRIVGVAAMALVACLGFIIQAFSQATAPGTAGPAGQAGPWGQAGPRGNFDPAQFRQRMDERMKEALGATDEEWKVLQPKIEKVQRLALQARGGMMMTRIFSVFVGAGPQSPGAEGQPQQTDMMKKGSDLQRILQKPDAKPEDIKPALAAYREARATARTELEQAQKDLQSLLTLRQEAVLVSQGLLD